MSDSRPTIKNINRGMVEGKLFMTEIPSALCNKGEMFFSLRCNKNIKPCMQADYNVKGTKSLLSLWCCDTNFFFIKIAVGLHSFAFAWNRMCLFILFRLRYKMLAVTPTGKFVNAVSGYAPQLAWFGMHESHPMHRGSLGWIQKWILE